ncbi:MAG: hypothetical protein MJZ64_02170 [Paludibacteraceae bacterium]|nr:hypothetical protein [Paludibacteraceae bacterium]
MKNSRKFGVIIIVFCLVGVVVVTGLNCWLTVLVRHQLNTQIAVADSVRISYGDVKLSISSGKAYIKDVYFCSDTLPFNDSARQVVEAKVGVLSLDGINYYDWLVHRQLHLKGLSIKEPSVRTRFLHTLDQNRGGDLRDQMMQDRLQRLEAIMNIVRIFLDDAVISRISIEDANIEAAAYNDSLRVCVPHFDMSVYDLGYNIKDKLLHYNDSVFHFMFKDVDVFVPEANLTLKVDCISAEPNGVMEINNVQIHTVLDSLRQEFLFAGVDCVYVGGFDAGKFNMVKELEIKNIHLYHPFATLCVNETADQKERSRRSTKKSFDEVDNKLLQTNMDLAMEFITGLDVDTLCVHNASLSVGSVTTDFQVHADSLSFTFYGLGYSLIDEIPYHYNDSVYDFSLGLVDVITPDSLVAITASDIRYDDSGVFSMNRTHIHHLVDRWQLTHYMNDQPVSWIDLVVNSVHTSSKNIVKEAFTLTDGFFLDTLSVDIESLSVFRDVRLKPTEPYRLPQTYFLGLDYPFIINHLDATVRDTHIELAITDKDPGVLNLGTMNLQVSNVTAIPDSTIRLLAHCHIGTGTADARFDLTVNPACDWHLALDAQQLNLHVLDDLLFPVVGMKIGCDVSRLTADYSGNMAVAEGSFCMEYDNFSLHAFKENDSPFTVVGKMSGLINSVGKTLLHKRNPSAPGKKPVAYRVKWKNDTWEDPALFYVGPMIDGCIETLLPGLFLHRRVKNKTPKTYDF